MKEVIKILGFCFLWVIIDIALLFICHEVLDNQHYLEGIFRIQSISVIGLIIQFTRYRHNIPLIIALLLSYILFNFYRITGMMEWSFLFYGITTSILGIICFLCIIFFNKSRLKKGITITIVVFSIWLAYSHIYNQFLEFYYKQDDIKINSEYKLKETISGQLPFRRFTQNKITITALFNEHCTICFEEMEQLKQIEMIQDDSSLVFVGVHTILTYDSVDVNKVRPYVPFPIYYDSATILYKSLKAKGVPQLIILDKHNKIRYHTVGYCKADAEIYTQKILDKIKEIKVEK